MDDRNYEMLSQKEIFGYDNQNWDNGTIKITRLNLKRKMSKMCGWRWRSETSKRG